jgi:hypothetical protein
MNKLSKDKKEKLIMVCLATGGLLALLNFFLIGMQQDALADVDRKISDRKDKVEKANQMVNMAARIQQNLEQNKQVLASKEEKMAPADQYRWIVETVPPFMAHREVNFEECTPKPVIQAPGLLPKFNDYKSAIFTIKASARFQDFGKFLADFENEFPYISVHSLRMRPEGSRNVRTAAPTVFDNVLRGNQASRAALAEPSEKLLFEMKLVTLIKP